MSARVLPAVASGLATLVVLGAVSPSTAQTRDPAGSEWLFREGRNLMKKGDFAPACAKLAESLRLDPAVGTLMNLAGCEERLGRTASAWQRWSAAVDQLPPSDKRRATALARTRALERNLARLTITLGPSTPTTAQVRRDEVVLGAASLGVPLPVDPGAHSISVTAPGREGREVEVVLAEGEQKLITLEPGAPTARSAFQPPLVPAVVRVAPPPFTPPAGTAAPVPGVVATQEQNPTAVRKPPVLGYVLTAGGVVAIAAGAYFGLQALSARGDAQESCADGNRRCWAEAAMAVDRDRRWSLMADVSLAAGVVGTATGLYLLLRPRPAQAAATVARLVPQANGGKVELVGRF